MTMWLTSVALLFGGAPSGEEDRLVTSFRSPRRCGPNCLWALAALYGVPKPYPAVVESAPDGPDGVSLQDLERAAGRLGLPARAVFSPPGELGSLALPAIAHLRQRDGHFVLLVEIDEDRVVLADMCLCQIRTASRSQFAEEASGYFLVVGDSPLHFLLRLAGSGALAFALLTLLAGWRRKR